MNITKGEWEARHNIIMIGGANRSVATVHVHNNFDMLTGKKVKDTEQEANAQLIAEAGTIANQTGLSPKQLLERLDEAKDILRHLVEWDSDSGGLGERERIISKAKLFLK